MAKVKKNSTQDVSASIEGAKQPVKPAAAPAGGTTQSEDVTAHPESTAGNTPESTDSAPKSENTGMDSADKSKATPTKGLDLDSTAPPTPQGGRFEDSKFGGEAKRLFSRMAVNVLYFTADGLAFRLERDAAEHAHLHLTDKNITVCSR